VLQVFNRFIATAFYTVIGYQSTIHATVIYWCSNRQKIKTETPLQSLMCWITRIHAFASLNVLDSICSVMKTTSRNTKIKNSNKNQYACIIFA